MQVATRLVPVCLCVAALVAGGCGSDDGASSGPPAAKLLSDTFGAAKPVRSGRLDLTLEVRARGLPNLRGPLVVHLSGPFQSRGAGRAPRFAFDLDLASGGSKVRAGAISTGTKAYLTFAERAYALPEGAFGALGSPAQSGRVHLELSLAALNREQAIGPPAHARPVAELAGAIRRVLGGNRRYDQCLHAAAADLAKAQACAGLVGQ